jgi:hypothetical protein
MFTDSRLLPAPGSFPKPGQDISGTPWQKLMRGSEIALFFFDAKTDQILTAKGEVPESPASEYCIAYRSWYMARRVARGRVTKNPRMICALYDKRGRWLATISRQGEDRRNPGLGLAWVLFQFPLLSFLGIVIIFVASALSALYFGTAMLRWERMSLQEWNVVIAAGLLLGGALRFVLDMVRSQMVEWHARPVRQPIGSPGRDKFYQRLARTNNSSLLVPLDITFVPTTIDWPSPEKYAEWTTVLQREGFEHFGSYLIPEVSTSTDLWFNSSEDMLAEIVKHSKAGVWLSVSTCYEDWSSFGVSNKNAPPIDPHPTKKTRYLGPEANADTVIEKARNDRPLGARRPARRESRLTNYATSWRQYVEWRRARRTTAEEYKRVAESKARAKAAGMTWP